MNNHVINLIITDRDIYSSVINILLINIIINFITLLVRQSYHELITIFNNYDQ